jgi:type IV secretory pathway TrbF-like protein
MTGILAKDAKNKSARFTDEFYDRVSNLRSNVRNWTLLTFLFVFVSFGLAYELWNVQQQKPAPELYVVRITPTEVSYGGTVKPIDPNTDPKLWTNVTENQLEKFVSLWRTVTSDEALATRNWSDCYAFVAAGTPAAQRLHEWFEEKDERENHVHDPIQRGQKGETVTVECNGSLAEGEKTILLDWTEITNFSDGQNPQKKHWRGRFTFSYSLPKEERLRQVNSFGVMVKELTFSEVNL